LSEMDKDFWNDAYLQDPRHVDVADRFLDAEIEGLEPGTALDLGCGSGGNALKLARHGWSVVGVDWAEQAIGLARQAAADQGLNLNFVVADITRWKPPREFDLVISTYALPGGEMSRRALETAATALASGGTLIVIEWDRSMSEIWGFDDDALLAPGQIVALLPGLEIEKAEVRHIEEPFAEPDDPRSQQSSFANVAFVRAKEPRHQ